MAQAPSTSNIGIRNSVHTTQGFFLHWETFSLSLDGL